MALEDGKTMKASRTLVGVKRVAVVTAVAMAATVHRAPASGGGG